MQYAYNELEAAAYARFLSTWNTSCCGSHQSSLNISLSRMPQIPGFPWSLSDTSSSTSRRNSRSLPLLLAAISAAGSFRAGSTERTWLIGILRHKLLDFFRRAARESELQQDWSTSTIDSGQDFDEQGSWRAPVNEWASPEKSLEKTEFWQIFNGCLDVLPEPLRSAFALREIEGLDSDALVETLNISSKNNLWVMLSRARQQIRGCLQAGWFEEK